MKIEDVSYQKIILDEDEIHLLISQYLDSRNVPREGRGPIKTYFNTLGFSGPKVLKAEVVINNGR